MTAQYMTLQLKQNCAVQHTTDHHTFCLTTLQQFFNKLSVLQQNSSNYFKQFLRITHKIKIYFSLKVTITNQTFVHSQCLIHIPNKLTKMLRLLYVMYIHIPAQT